MDLNNFAPYYAAGVRILIPILLGVMIVLCTRAYVFCRNAGYLIIGVTQLFAFIISVYSLFNPSMSHDARSAVNEIARDAESRLSDGRIESPIERIAILPPPRFPIGLVCFTVGIWLLQRREVKLARKEHGVPPND